jgi:hypothetical protein
MPFILFDIFESMQQHHSAAFQVAITCNGVRSGGFSLVLHEDIYHIAGSPLSWLCPGVSVTTR